VARFRVRVCLVGENDGKARLRGHESLRKARRPALRWDGSGERPCRRLTSDAASRVVNHDPRRGVRKPLSKCAHSIGSCSGARQSPLRSTDVRPRLLCRLPWPGVGSDLKGVQVELDNVAGATKLIDIPTAIDQDPKRLRHATFRSSSRSA
jgi:hypothetical protein